MTRRARLTVAVIGMVLCAASAVYGAQLSAADVTAAPGSSVTVSVFLNSQGASISGIQFDIEWDGGALIVAPLPGPGIERTSKQLYTAGIGRRVHDRSKTRYLIIGVNNRTLPDEELIRLFIVVRPEAESGVYGLSISNVKATTPDGQGTNLTVVGPKITVQNSSAASTHP